MSPKKPKKSFITDIGEDWENRLAFIDGEFDEDPEELLRDTPATNLSESVAAVIKQRRRRTKKQSTIPTQQSRERSAAQRTVTRLTTNLTEDAVKKALPQIALKLSQEARRTMKRAGRTPSRFDVELAAEYLRQTAGAFELVKRQRDAAYFRLMLIAWLTETGGTKDDLKEALSLAPATETMFDPVVDAVSRKKLLELKSEIRRLLREL